MIFSAFSGTIENYLNFKTVVCFYCMLISPGFASFIFLRAIKKKLLKIKNVSNKLQTVYEDRNLHFLHISMVTVKSKIILKKNYLYFHHKSYCTLYY